MDSRWKSVTLPSGLDRCYAESKRVIATCQNGQAFHWSWGGILEELTPCVDVSKDVSGRPSLRRISGGTPGAILHPREDVCFLVHIYQDSPTEDPVLTPANVDSEGTFAEAGGFHSW